MNWAEHFKKASQPKTSSDFGGITHVPMATFGAIFGASAPPPAIGPEPASGAWQNNKAYITKYQTALTWLAQNLNKPSWDPQGNDGAFGPHTQAAVKAFQSDNGITPVDGEAGTGTSTAIDNLVAKTSGKTPPKPTPTPAPSGVPTVNIATVVAALKQAASEKGYNLNDTLLSLMIGQLRGAEGAYPGVNSSLGGTNNMGAAQVTKSLQSAKNGLKGWGAFAHRDSDPNAGAYIGWYWIAPTPLEAARHWFQDNWWGDALGKGNPQDATSYAAILYKGKYFAGMHPGDPSHDPESDAGKLNVADYAAAISRGKASANEMAQPAGNINQITVDPTKFATLDARKITEALFDQAKNGGQGSAWGYLLPSTWQDMVNSNGVVWFGPPITAALAAGKVIGKTTFVASVAAAVGVLYFWFTRKKWSAKS